MDVVNLSRSRRFLRERPMHVTLFDRPRIVCDLLCLEGHQTETRRGNAASDMLFVVIEGAARIRTGSQSEELQEMDAVLVPPDVDATIENTGAGQLVVLVTVTPKPTRAAEVRVPGERPPVARTPRGPRLGDRDITRGGERSSERSPQRFDDSRPRPALRRDDRGPRPPFRRDDRGYPTRPPREGDKDRPQRGARGAPLRPDERPASPRSRSTGPFAARPRTPRPPRQDGDEGPAWYPREKQSGGRPFASRPGGRGAAARPGGRPPVRSGPARGEGAGEERRGYGGRPGGPGRPPSRSAGPRRAGDSGERPARGPVNRGGGSGGAPRGRGGSGAPKSDQARRASRGQGPLSGRRGPGRSGPRTSGPRQSP